jgi:flavin reductase (DIM6/NTAB) family NADH-FMN oxidoreductase RutF
VFYEVEKDDHGLEFNPYKSCIVPRPIAWVSTISVDGVLNLAPFSQFNSLSHDPPFVMFSGGMRPDGLKAKDTVINAQRTGEFVVNMATWDLREQVNQSAQFFPEDVDEMQAVGLETEPSRLVKPPRVAASPIHLECKYHSTIVLPARSVETIQNVVIGQVVGVHIRDDVIINGKVDITRIRPLARMGYLDYAVIDQVFEMDVVAGEFGDALRKTHMGRPSKS